VAHTSVGVRGRDRAVCANGRRRYSPSPDSPVDLDTTDHPPTGPVPKEAATLRLMLIEDDRTYAWLVEEMLVAAFSLDELDVVLFGSLSAAIEEKRLVDCALVDLSLPDASGLGVIDTVLLALPDVPVVVLTGAEDEQLALQAVERGAQDYLVKRRVDPEVLGRSVRYAIERKRAEGQRGELLRARAAHAEAEALSGMLGRLQEVADAAIPVQGHLDRVELLDRSLAVIAADTGALIVQPPGGAPPTIAAARGLLGVSTATRIDEAGVTADVLRAEAPMVVEEVDDQDASTLGPRARVRSLVAVPLEADGRRLGVLVATSGLPDRFSEEQARLLALAGERCSRALANAAAYERERRTAAALQAGLLPQGVPPLRHGQIAVRYLPALGGPAVGGDWYDAILLPDGRLGLAIGDVTGHGAEAAVLMGQLRTALRAYALEGSSPDLVASRLNALALSLGDDAMATLVYAILDPSLRTGSFVNAGHPPPVRISAAGAAQLSARSSPPVGASAGSTFDQHAFELVAGDALCLYSDGLVEERGADLPEREQELLAALGTPAAAEVLCERALAALRPHGAADDDVALLVLQTSESGHGLRTTHPAHPDELSEARAVLRGWLETIGASNEETSEILLAANEACMNVIEHAYDPDVNGNGTFTLEGHVDEQTVVLIVRDEGRWSEVRARGRGRGLKLMEAMMDSVQLSFSSEGTIVVLRRTLSENGS
jgi:serine phosphatase RsbU (regulator of sigma subunit)/anti-sigma regulatory factor (Ser/Thr protein kinase)/FixJ family two-component response regulator